MPQQRTIYFNDARHYYLFVHEPPMRMEDAWGPIDEVAGTGVDTFIYGVSRGDGLFYPSKVGLRFGADEDGFDMAAYWRVWENMQSLIGRGLDPLQMLIDRAHDKGMDFVASLRMGDHPGLDAKYTPAGGGRGYVHQEVRDFQLALLQELATDYPVDGVELDFAAAPAGTSFCLKDEDVAEHGATMTEFVRQVSRMVRQRRGGAGQIGVRVYPTEALNAATGLQVKPWLEERLVDYIVPLVYARFVLDPNMPIDWLVQAAHQHDVSVYGMLQPYYSEEHRRFINVVNASVEMMRAASANFRLKGVDGLYTWFLRWPLGADERHILTELGDADLIREGDKHYFLSRRSDDRTHDYDVPLPLDLPVGSACQIPFTIADDPDNDRVQTIALRLGLANFVSADRLALRLNGQPLADEPTRCTSVRRIDPYMGMWLVVQLQKVRPRRGENLLELTLQERPPRLQGNVTLDDIEVIVKYGTYPPRQEAGRESRPARVGGPGGKTDRGLAESHDAAASCLPGPGAHSPPK